MSIFWFCKVSGHLFILVSRCHSLDQACEDIPIGDDIQNETVFFIDPIFDMVVPFQNDIGGSNYA